MLNWCGVKLLKGVRELIFSNKTPPLRRYHNCGKNSDSREVSSWLRCKVD